MRNIILKRVSAIFLFFYFSILSIEKNAVWAAPVEESVKDLGVEYSKIMNLVNSSGRDALPKIRQLLNGSDFVTKTAALKSLSEDPFRCGDIEPLVTPYLETGHILLRIYAAKSLIKHKCIAQKELMRNLLSNERDERLRRVYIDYFSHAGAKDDIPLLKTVQDDVEGNLSIRLSAAQAIAVLGGTIDYALVDSSLSSANHQKDAIRILAFSSNLGDVSRLEPFLARQGELRDEAKVAMGRITIVNSDLSIPEKRTRLFQYLNDDSDRVRFWSAEQLLFLSSMDPSILVELKKCGHRPQSEGLIFSRNSFNY
jgi:HEAT repeat protein